MHLSEFTLQELIDRWAQMKEWPYLLELALIFENAPALSEAIRILGEESVSDDFKPFVDWIAECALNTNHFLSNAPTVPESLPHHAYFICKLIAKTKMFWGVRWIDLAPPEDRHDLLMRSFDEVGLMLSGVPPGDQFLVSFLLFQKSLILEKMEMPFVAIDCRRESSHLIEEMAADCPRIFAPTLIFLEIETANLHAFTKNWDEFARVATLIVGRLEKHKNLAAELFADSKVRILRTMATVAEELGQTLAAIRLLSIALNTYRELPPEEKHKRLGLANELGSHISAICRHLNDHDLHLHFQDLLSKSFLPQLEATSSIPQLYIPTDIDKSLLKIDQARRITLSDGVAATSLFDDGINELTEAIDSMRFRIDQIFDFFIPLVQGKVDFACHLCRSGDFDKATEVLDSAIEIANDRQIAAGGGMAHHLYGQILRSKSDFAGASAHFEIAFGMFRHAFKSRRLFDLTYLLESVISLVECRFKALDRLTRRFLFRQLRLLHLTSNLANSELNIASNSSRQGHLEFLFNDLVAKAAECSTLIGGFARTKSSCLRCFRMAASLLERAQAVRLNRFIAGRDASARRATRWSGDEAVSDSSWKQAASHGMRLLFPETAEQQAPSGPNPILSFSDEEVLGDFLHFLDDLKHGNSDLSDPYSLVVRSPDLAIVYFSQMGSKFQLLLAHGSDFLIRLYDDESSSPLAEEIRNWVRSSNGFRLNQQAPSNANFVYSPLPLLEEMVIQVILENFKDETKQILLCLDPFFTPVPIEHHRPETGIALSERFTVSRIPSVRLFEGLGAPSPGKAILAAINPRGDLTFSDLEASVLRRCFSGIYLEGADATAAHIAEHIEEANIFYFSGHAIYNSERPYQSKLVTADPRGISLVDCLTRWNLKRCNLAFLNGCETAQGLGGVDHTRITTNEVLDLGLLIDENINLAHAFLAAGARCVIATLWSVPDVSSFLVVWRFSKAFADEATTDIASCLRRAISWLQAIESRDVLMERVLPELFSDIGVNLQSPEADRIQKQFLDALNVFPSALPFGNPAVWSQYVVIGNPKLAVPDPEG
jgi:CHAT domain-containing protein/tetratricopeptide (TPR) repeat protein